MLAQRRSPAPQSLVGPHPDEVEVPLDTHSQRRHKARFDFWLGIDDDPLTHWPCVSSECSLSVQELNQLLFEFFPGQSAIAVELVNVYRFIDSCRLPDHTWKSTLPISTHVKLHRLVQLVCWTEFREFFNAALLLPFCSLWMHQPLLACNSRFNANSNSNGSSNAMTDSVSSANKRLASGKSKKRPSASNSPTATKSPHFCVGAPSALATSTIQHPLVPRTVRSSQCLVSYMSRMYEPTRVERYAPTDRDESDRPIYYIRVHDFSLVRPAKHQELLRLVQLYSCDSSHDGLDRDVDMIDASDELAGSFGLFRDDFDDSEHDMRMQVRSKILSCLRLWQIDQQDHAPGHHGLDPQRLHQLARLLVECTRSPQLDIKALRSLAAEMRRFLDRFGLVAHRDYAPQQPGAGFAAVERLLVRQHTGEQRGLWHEIAKSVIAVLAGEHAPLLLDHLVRQFEHCSSNTVLVRILARAFQYHSSDLSASSAPSSSSSQPQSATAESLVDAFAQCSHRYHQLFQGQRIECDLNQTLLQKLNNIRLGWDTAAVAKESKGRKAKHRRVPVPSSPSTLASLAAGAGSTGEEDILQPTSDPPEDDGGAFIQDASSDVDANDDDDEAEGCEQDGEQDSDDDDLVDCLPPRRRRRTPSNPGSPGSLASSAGLNSAHEMFQDEIMPDARTDQSALVVSSPGLGRRAARSSSSSNIHIAAVQHHLSTPLGHGIGGLGRRWRGLAVYSPETTWSDTESSISTVATPFRLHSPILARGLQQLHSSASLHSSHLIHTVGSLRTTLDDANSWRQNRGSHGGASSGDGSSQFCRILSPPPVEFDLDERQDVMDGQHQDAAAEIQDGFGNASSSDMELCADPHSTFVIHRPRPPVSSSCLSPAAVPALPSPSSPSCSVLGLQDPQQEHPHPHPHPQRAQVATADPPASSSQPTSNPLRSPTESLRRRRRRRRRRSIPDEHSEEAGSDSLPLLTPIQVASEGDEAEVEDGANGRIFWSLVLAVTAALAVAAVLAVAILWNRSSVVDSRFNPTLSGGNEESGSIHAGQPVAPLPPGTALRTDKESASSFPPSPRYQPAPDLDVDPDQDLRNPMPAILTSTRGNNMEGTTLISMADYAALIDMPPLQLPSNFCRTSSATSNRDGGDSRSRDGRIEDMDELNNSSSGDRSRPLKEGGEGMEEGQDICWINVSILQMKRLAQHMMRTHETSRRLYRPPEADA